MVFAVVCNADRAVAIEKRIGSKLALTIRLKFEKKNLQKVEKKNVRLFTVSLTIL